MPRLFVAVWPPPDVVEQLAALRRKDQRGVRFVDPERWHVTLRFLGQSDPWDVRAALDDELLPAATARLGPAVDVLAERAVVVPVAGLDELAAIVTRRTRAIGVAPGKRFTGHLTLARVKPRVPMPSTVGALVGAAFDVDEIALVESRLDPRGARYETIHTWPVGGRAEGRDPS